MTALKATWMCKSAWTGWPNMTLLSARFTPAPYVQLANVLRQQGFAREAAQVLIRREDKQRAAEWDAAITGMDGTLRRELTGYAHVFLPFLKLGFQMDVRIWSPARAGLALDRHNLGGHLLLCRANPPPRAIRTDLRCRAQLARMAAQLPKHAPPRRLAALACAIGCLGQDRTRARL